MIEELRKKTKSLVVKILLALLVSSFALWGVGDIFRNRSNQIIANVEDEKITLSAFNKEYLNNLNQLQQQTGQAGRPGADVFLRFPALVRGCVGHTASPHSPHQTQNQPEVGGGDSKASFRAA